MAYALRLVRRARHPAARSTHREVVSYGASVRAAQYLILGAKAGP